jgi:SMC interacting uncharacterized protein involved in chromosome segregation
VDEFTNLSRTIERLKLDSKQMILNETQRMHKAKKEFEIKMDSVSSSRDRVLNQVVNGLVEAFGFHQHITNTLDELKSLANFEE